MMTDLLESELVTEIRNLARQIEQLGETLKAFNLPVKRAPAGENPLNLKTWKAYKAAYQQRYKTDPVRNASVNAKIKQIVARLGNNAPDVAAHYVWCNAAYYVRDKHTVGPLLKDCEGLHTEWATGKTVTNAEARQVDATQSRANVWGELIAEEKARAIVN